MYIDINNLVEFKKMHNKSNHSDNDIQLSMHQDYCIYKLYKLHKITDEI